MHAIDADDEVVEDFPAGYKSTLVLRDDLLQRVLETGDDALGNGFVNDVA